MYVIYMNIEKSSVIVKNEPSGVGRYYSISKTDYSRGFERISNFAPQNHSPSEVLRSPYMS